MAVTHTFKITQILSNFTIGSEKVRKILKSKYFPLKAFSNKIIHLCQSLYARSFMNNYCVCYNIQHILNKQSISAHLEPSSGYDSKNYWQCAFFCYLIFHCIKRKMSRILPNLMEWWISQRNPTQEIEQLLN